MFTQTITLTLCCIACVTLNDQVRGIGVPSLLITEYNKSRQNFVGIASGSVKNTDNANQCEPLAVTAL